MAEIWQGFTVALALLREETLGVVDELFVQFAELVGV
jgi:hypothetical protein